MSYFRNKVIIKVASVLSLCALIVLLYSCGVAKRFAKKRNPNHSKRTIYHDTLVVVRKRKAPVDSTVANPNLAHNIFYESTGDTLFVPTPYKLIPSNSAKSVVMIEQGMASWYGPGFNGLLTASGEVFNTHELTAAHRTLPFNTLVLVQNTSNGKSVVVRITDRGPFAKNRIIDLSKKAAKKIGMIGPGTAHVKLYIAKKALPQADTLNILIPTYTIQLGSFANEQNAYDLSHKVQGSRVEIVQIDDKFRYRVYYGLYTAYNNAREAQEKLAKKRPTCFVQQIANFGLN